MTELFVTFFERFIYLISYFDSILTDPIFTIGNGEDAFSVSLFGLFTAGTLTFILTFGVIKFFTNII